MKPANALLIYKKGFVENTKAIRDWINGNAQTGKGPEFALELEDFILTKIITYPTHYPEWKWKRTKDKLYRRAIFRKKYVLVFKYFPNQVEMLAIYHQSRDASKIEV
jgi:hypothetical protein